MAEDTGASNSNSASQVVKKILVAGGAGFIGSHLCDQLLAAGNSSSSVDLTVVDCLITGRKKNIVHLLTQKNFHFIEADICDAKVMTELSKTKWDEIYNLASPASPVDFTKIPLFILLTGSVGHKNLLDLAQKSACAILLTSTSEVYGDPLVHPQTENYFGNVNTMGVRGCYDESKRFAEALSAAHYRMHKTQIRIARIFNTYGPRMNPEDGRIIPNFFMQALHKKPLSIYGDGTQTRSFCYVTDMIDGLMKLMKSSVTTPVNIGNPIELKVLEMAQIINQLTKNTAGVTYFPLPENDPKQRRPDISKAKQELGWEPKVALAEGLQKTFEYFARS